MIQNNDTQMAEKIQSTIVNTIPLWKNQMVIALGIQHSAQAAEMCIRDRSWILDGQADMSKQGDRPDYEDQRQMGECTARSI